MDFSTQMIDKCQESAKELPEFNGEYYCADITNMPFLDTSTIDKIISTLCFPNLETSIVKNALLEFHRVLKPNGELVFSILHPCFEPGLGGWELGEKDSSGRRKGKFFKIDHYFQEQSYERIWKGPEGKFPQPMVFVHRTLEDYFSLISNASFTVEQVKEPFPTKEAIQKNPNWFDKEQRVPFFLVFKCQSIK